MTVDPGVPRSSGSIVEIKQLLCASNSAGPVLLYPYRLDRPATVVIGAEVNTKSTTEM